MIALYIIAGVILLFLIIELALGFGFFTYAMKPRPFKPEKIDPVKHPWVKRMLEKIEIAERRVDEQRSDALEMYSRDGYTLRGTYYINPDSEVTVALFNGYNMYGMADFAGVIPDLLDKGYSVFLPDQRGCGKSGGDYITFGVKESADVVDWCRLITLKYKPKSIFIMGRSLGAATVMMSAGEGLPSNVKGIIADCGFTSPYEQFRHVLKRDFRIPEFLVMPVTDMICGVKAKYRFKEKDTREILKNSPFPLLLIHGEEDDFVPTRMSYENYEAAGCEKELIIIPEAAHAEAFSKDHERCIKACFDFINKYKDAEVLTK